MLYIYICKKKFFVRKVGHNFFQSALCIFLMKDGVYLHKNSQAH